MEIWSPAELNHEITKKRLANDLDFLCFIDGHKGFGKSCLSYYLGSNNDPDYSLQKNFVFKKGKDDIINKHMALPKGKWLNVDEGQRSFFNLGFMDPEQIALWKFYNESRKANIATTFCTPDFMKLGSALVNVGDMRIHVVARGVGVIFWPYENAVSYDRWQIKECQKIFKEETEGLKAPQIDLAKKVEIYTKFPTFYGIVKWPDWPKEVKKEYLLLDAQAKAEALAEEGAFTRERKDFLNFGKIALFATENGFSQSFLAKYLHISTNYLNEAINVVKTRAHTPPKSQTTDSVKF